MKNNDHRELEKHVEKKYAARDRKKRPKMKMSGKSVFTLERLMSAKRIAKKRSKKHV